MIVIKEKREKFNFRVGSRLLKKEKKNLILRREVSFFKSLTSR
ncbi:hypothetical protein [Methanosarcina sp.]